MRVADYKYFNPAFDDQSTLRGDRSDKAGNM